MEQMTLCLRAGVTVKPEMTTLPPKAESGAQQ